ncbi:MAG: TetR family transcriptional regulator [Methylobacteriaceae bacterium]|nr:TetR family transcriptional regulator [Methylobacteriaceae bacterium]
MNERAAGAEWIDAGLRALREDGLEAVRVERLAKALGKTKGSFYWHFADRPALLTALAEAWRARATGAVIDEVEAGGGDAADKLRRLFAITLAADGRLERAMRDWAARDAGVAAIVAAVDARRHGYVADRLVEAGVAPATAQWRSRFLYLAIIGRFAAAPAPMSAEEARAMIAAIAPLLGGER